MATLVLRPEQKLKNVAQDRAAKGIVYLVRSRDYDWIMMCQSLPLLCRFINGKLSNGQAYDTVSLTSLHDNLNKTSGRTGGFVKGKWRTQTIPLEQCASEFERQRAEFENAVLISANPNAYCVEQ
eukprot:647002-Prymnesium_polylepis.1